MRSIKAWFEKVVTEIGHDLTSLRATWAWVYLALYACLAVYGALKVHEAFGTIITVTGGVVSVIFTSYVLSTQGRQS
jgi:hypothetical protein